MLFGIVHLLQMFTFREQEGLVNIVLHMPIKFGQGPWTDQGLKSAQ
jgi:hypothetical protein